MENDINTKRGYVLILVIATVIIFVGLVWLIATYLPRDLFGFPGPGFTTAALRVEKNCTYPISYWKEHPELYPPGLVLGNKVYQVNDIQGILSGEVQDSSAQLQAQLVGTFLNILSGADQGLIETTIFQSYNWLIQHPDGSQISDSERETGLRYYNVLEAYNLGLAGVAACQVEPTVAFTGTTAPTETPTMTPSQTATPTVSGTPTPTPTLTPTGKLTTPVMTVVIPTPTSIPTTGIPGFPSATPGRTQARTPTKTPTNTFVAPTWTPSPKPTNAPTNTPAPPTPTKSATLIPTLPNTSTIAPTLPPP